jgi:hypothetical protein
VPVYPGALCPRNSSLFLVALHPIFLQNVSGPLRRGHYRCGLDHDRRERHDEDTDRYLNRVQSRFAVHDSSDLYVPKHLKLDEQPPNADDPGTTSTQRLLFDGARNWLPILISATTLLLLGLTVLYTRRQWRTMNDTLGEIRQQTSSAQTTAIASQNMAQAAHEANETTQRMLEARFVMNFQLRSDKGLLNVVFKNVGKAEARNVSASGEATTQSIVNDNSDRFCGQTELPLSRFHGSFAARSFVAGSFVKVPAPSGRCEKIDFQLLRELGAEKSCSRVP